MLPRPFRNACGRVYLTMTMSRQPLHLPFEVHHKPLLGLGGYRPSYHLFLSISSAEVSKYDILHSWRPHLIVSPETALRWKLAYLEKKRNENRHGLWQHSWQLLWRLEGSVKVRRRNFRFSHPLRDATSLMGIIIAGLSYGGLHIIAWAAPFASSAEMYLWRISSLAIAVSGFVVLGTKLLADACDYVPENLTDLMDVVSTVWIVVVAMPFGLLYVLARGYLVVECFVNIAHLPDSVYQVPAWSQYFPHIA